MAPWFSLKWVNISPDFVSNEGGEQRKEGYWTLNGRPVLNLEIPWVKVERPDLLVEETMTYTQDAYHWTETGSLIWNDLRGGGGNNKITWFGSAASVDAGAGDDYVNGTEQAYDAAFGEVYGGGVEDREHASVGVLLYGNDGNDTLLGTMDDDELIGGAGEDKLDGYAGADTYRIYGASTGVDVIFDSGALIYRPYEWDGPTGAPRTIGGRNDYYLTQDVLRQASGMLSFPGTYEGNVPLANDIAGMEWLFNEGVIGKDSVVFDHGITQSDLTVTRGNITLQGITRETLDISWGTGRGIRVVMPNAQDAVGLGIERFVFSDGQVLDARQMAALGQPVGLNPDLQPGQSLTDFDSTGENTVSTAASLTLTNGFENLVLTGSGNANGTGNAADNVLKGNAGINHLDGEAGADTMYGGAGDDLYEVDNAADVVIEFFDEGTDTIRTTISRTLEANVEHGIATGAAAIDLRGNHLDNQLQGNDASNLLNGGAGNDTLSGKGGNDTYHVDSNRDVIVETADGGTDHVISTAQGYALSDHTEALELTEEAILGRGNAMANVIHGNAQSNYLLGGNGNDQLFDGEGDDVLDGGAGMDVMSGRQGNDVYVVDSDADTVIEAAEEGVDVVISSASVTLVDNAETLLLTGGQAISGTGNSADNLIAGNSASNELNGGAGNDTLHGTADVLLSTAYLADIRDAVNQHLFGIGGSAPAPSGNASSIHGVDTLRGGEGDDTYYVEDAQDVLIEQAEEGFDTVNSSVSLTLSAHIEQLVLTGTDDIDGLAGDFSNDVKLYGNVGNNRLVGSTGADALDGAAGIDTLEGGLGDDVYYIDNAGDSIIELADGGIEDQAYVSTSYTTTSDHVEFYQLTGSDNLSLTAGSGAGFHLWGNEGSNLLTGGDGSDELYGNFGGIDTLKGGKGDDLYYLTSATDLVMENTDEGFEEVSVLFNNYILTDNVEVLRLLGAVSTGTGNADSNGLFGNGASNKLYGLGGDDLIQSYGGNDTLEGGKGDDLLAGGTGNDTYVYNPDDGYDYISNQDATGNDTLLIHGATESQIWLRVTGKDMNISVIGRDGEVTVANWTQGNSYQIDNIKLDNGKTLSAGNAANLVNAMAGLAPPPAGQTTLPGNYQTSLNSAIAANWV